MFNLNSLDEKKWVVVADLLKSGLKKDIDYNEYYDYFLPKEDGTFDSLSDEDFHALSGDTLVAFKGKGDTDIMVYNPDNCSFVEEALKALPSVLSDGSCFDGNTIYGLLKSDYVPYSIGSDEEYKKIVEMKTSDIYDFLSDEQKDLLAQELYAREKISTLEKSVVAETVPIRVGDLTAILCAGRLPVSVGDALYRVVCDDDGIFSVEKYYLFDCFINKDDSADKDPSIAKDTVMVLSPKKIVKSEVSPGDTIDELRFAFYSECGFKVFKDKNLADALVAHLNES